MERKRTKTHKQSKRIEFGTMVRSEEHGVGMVVEISDYVVFVVEYNNGNVVRKHSLREIEATMY